MPELSVIVPVWNEAEILQESSARITEALDSGRWTWEVIWVDDGSSDTTLPQLKDLAARDARQRIVSFTRNFGQHPAVMAGFELASGEYIATIDADLQNPPSAILMLMDAMGIEDDVVVGVREARGGSPLRRLGSSLANQMLTRAGNLPAEDYGSMLRVYRRSVVEQVLECHERTLFITALTAWLGFNHKLVVVEQGDRIGGTSKYSFFKLLRRYMDLLVGFSDFPLQVVSALGVIVALVGLAASLALAVWRVLYGPGVSGLVLIAALLVGLAGLQLLGMGVLGQYIGRVLQQVYARPTYVISETVNLDE